MQFAARQTLSVVAISIFTYTFDSVSLARARRYRIIGINDTLVVSAHPAVATRPILERVKLLTRIQTHAFGAISTSAARLVVFFVFANVDALLLLALTDQTAVGAVFALGARIDAFVAVAFSKVAAGLSIGFVLASVGGGAVSVFVAFSKSSAIFAFELACVWRGVMLC